MADSRSRGAGGGRSLLPTSSSSSYTRFVVAAGLFHRCAEMSTTGGLLVARLCCRPWRRKLELFSALFPGGKQLTVTRVDGDTSTLSLLLPADLNLNFTLKTMRRVGTEGGGSGFGCSV